MKVILILASHIILRHHLVPYKNIIICTLLGYYKTFNEIMMEFRRKYDSSRSWLLVVKWGLKGFHLSNIFFFSLQLRIAKNLHNKEDEIIVMMQTKGGKKIECNRITDELLLFHMKHLQFCEPWAKEEEKNYITCIYIEWSSARMYSCILLNPFCCLFFIHFCDYVEVIWLAFVLHIHGKHFRNLNSNEQVNDTRTYANKLFQFHFLFLYIFHCGFESQMDLHHYPLEIYMNLLWIS